MFKEDKPENHRQYLPAGYRKKSVLVSIVGPGTSITVDTDWSGGSRSYYCLFKKGSNSGEPVGGGGFVSRERPKITLEAGDVLVESGILMGKPTRAHIHYCENVEKPLE